jgi:hypothetical protein
VINGQSFDGGQNQYTYDSDDGSYTLEFVAGFSGSFGPIQVFSSSDTSFQIVGGNGDGTARGADSEPVIGTVDEQSAAAVTISVFDQLRHLRTLTLGLDAATLGGSAGRLQQLSTGGSKSGLGGNADHAVRIAKQALAYVGNVESLLERAALRGAKSVVNSPTISAAEALRTALDIRRTVRDTGVVPFHRSSIDSRLVFDLLLATSR